MKKYLLSLLLLIPIALCAQKPVGTLPTGCTGTLGGPYTCNVMDTTYLRPVGGTTWNATSNALLTNALNSSQPGDVIVLTAGYTYSGNFTLPVKTNPNGKWIYIVTSDYTGLPATGVRVAPTDVSHMATIISTNSTAPITLAQGADHWRFVGVEVTTTSAVGSPRPFTYQLIETTTDIGFPMCDSIIVDRSYIHGTTAIDVQHAISANCSNFAVIDSYISETHFDGADSQAIGLWFSPGPIKIVNNYLEAAGENVLFGGAGGLTNPWVPSDIEIRNNWFIKPLSWDVVGVGVPPNNTMVIKNHLEFKSARRVLVDNNIFENIWVSGQNGFSLAMTPRTNSSGLSAVVDDITVTNNVFKNISSGVDMLAHNDPQTCVPAQGCTAVGELKRIIFYNNSFQLGPTTQPGYGGSAFNYGMLLIANVGQPYATDILIQHNSIIPPPNVGYCKGSIYVDISGTAPFTPAYSRTTNVWVIDNNFCRQIYGPAGWVGQFSYNITDYMGDPAPPDTRFIGNYLFKASGDTAYTVPANNVESGTAPTYDSNFIMLTPDLTTKTTDGRQAGSYIISNVLTITISTLPNGIVGTAYSTTLTAAGGTTPYTWSILSGSLCSGLSLSSGGVISGTPTTAQTCTFTAQVTDNVSATAQKAFSITVTPTGTKPLFGPGVFVGSGVIVSN